MLLTDIAHFHSLFAPLGPLIGLYQDLQAAGHNVSAANIIQLKVSWRR